MSTLEHKLVSVYVEREKGLILYVCTCLQEGDRMWFENHLVGHKSVIGGMFLRHVKINR